MKFFYLLLIIFISYLTYPQTTTYSKEEERMLQYVNNGLAYAIKYDSLENVKSVIDSVV